MRILTNEDVESVLDPEECLSVLEVAYKEHATGAVRSQVGREAKGEAGSLLGAITDEVAMVLVRDAPGDCEPEAMTGLAWV